MQLTVVVGVAFLALSACASSSRETVLNLDTTDRKWTSRECVAARKAVADFDEHRDGHAAIATMGNLIVPFAGSATSFAMNRLRDDERAELNRRVRAACISDPLRASARRR